jgi:predicted secreted protein with PEFG-CTERM motif
MRQAVSFAYALIAVLIGSTLSMLPLAQPSYASHENITVDIDKIEYEQNDEVVITGVIDDIEDGEDVEIRITPPTGSSDNEEADFNEDTGDYSLLYEIDGNAPDGIYKVEVSYNDEQVYSFFIVDEDTDPVFVVMGDDSYAAGDEVEIEGSVDNPDNDVDEVEITIIDPTDAETVNSHDEEIDDDDEFAYAFDLEDDAVHGRYAVTVSYANEDDDEGYAIFEVEDEDSGSNEPITVTLSKSTYAPGTNVQIEGEVDEESGEDEVNIVVLDPDDEEILDEDVELGSGGSYEYDFDLNDEAEEGEYTVTVSYNGDEEEVTFDVSSTTSGGSSSSDLTVKLDKASYLAGNSMTITGKVPKTVSDAVINIDVFNPDGTFAGVFTTAEPKSDLSYSATLELKSDLDADEGYTVEVNYGSYSGEAEFEITGKSSTSSELTVKTDKTEYENGSTVRVSGTVSSDSLVEGQRIFIIVNKPDGSPYRTDQIQVSSSGTFTYDFPIGGELAPAGEYEVQVTYGDEETTAEFELVGSGGTSYNLKVGDGTYPIEYEITSGNVKSMFVRTLDNTLVISIDAEEDGQIVVVLPREVIDSVEEGSDKSYVVATADLEAGVGNENVVIRESGTTDDARTVVIDYEAGTDLIEISGTQVVPEFGPVSAIVLAVAIVGIIVATARTQKLSFFR